MTDQPHAMIRLAKALAVLLACPAVVFALLGASTVAYGKGELAAIERNAGRQPVIATVTKRNIGSAKDGEIPVSLGFSWQAAGRQWHSKRADRYAKFSTAITSKHDLATRYPIGQELPLWVHPDKPSRILWEGPSFASAGAAMWRVRAGILLLVAAIGLWLTTLVRIVRGPDPDTTDDKHYLLAGAVHSWPQPVRVHSWLIVAVAIQSVLAGGTWLAADAHLTNLKAGAQQCELMNIRLSPDDGKLRIEARVHADNHAQWTDWLDTGARVQPDEQSAEVLRSRRLKLGALTPCWGADGGPTEVTIQAPSRLRAAGYGWLGLCALWSVLLMLGKKLRMLRASQATAPRIDSEWRDPAVRAAIDAMGPTLPTGFRASYRRSRSGSEGVLRLQSVTLGGEDMDAFLSIFHTLILAGIVALPVTVYNDNAGWQGIVGSLGIAAFFGVFAYFIVPDFTRRTAGRLVLELSPASLAIRRELLGFSRSTQVSRRAVSALSQVQDGGFSSDSFPSWGLLLIADREVELLRREQPYRSRWLGPVIAAWAAVPYRHAGEYRSHRRVD